MQQSSSPRTPLVGAVAVALLIAAPASAQVSGGPIDLQLFRPAIDSKGFITLDASQVLGHLDPSFGLVLSYARSPLSIRSSTTVSGAVWCSEVALDTGRRFGQPGFCPADKRIDSAYRIDNLVTGNLQAALGLWSRFEIGLGLPLTFYNGDTQPDTELAAPGRANPDEGAIDAQGVGDLTIHLKGRILDTSRHPVGLALIASASFPTGGRDRFLGSGRFGIHPKLVVDKAWWGGRLKASLNIGLRLRFGGPTTWRDGGGALADSSRRRCQPQDPTSASFDDEASWPECGTGKSLQTNHHLFYGLGFSFGVIARRLELVAEIIGQTGLTDPFDFDALNSAHELLAGLKVYLAHSSYFTLGVGRGLRGQSANHQYGSPDVRAYLGFVFEPGIGDRDGDGIKDDVDRCPARPEDFDDFEDGDGCPDPDNDRDGILDTDDRCPNEPEDRDHVEDADGCPEADVLDRDGDGLPDDKDKCPDEPEDKDGFEDADGCPDPDNDRDGILDVDDLCPNKPEDKDGFEDKDGCPDPDNDSDRILDVDDECPNEPETYNGYQDKNGCPDKVVKRGRGKLIVLQKIYFETDRAVIKRESYPVLDAVARSLQQNRDIRLLEIQGHADERGSASYNMRLTRARAGAVRRYLIAKGVAATRLRARGYGESRPRDRHHTAAAWSKNRRVEFVIVKH